MADSERKFTLPLSELIDRLTIDQIKEVLLTGNKESFSREMEKISYDIDLIVEEKDIKLSARLLRIIIAIAQLNLHIWHNKDRMQEDTENYMELLKFSHQLNGIRNQMKNLLLELTGDREKSSERTNFNTDGLTGWEISIK